MNILLKSVTISDPSSTHFNSVKDIFIKNGKIVSIEKKLSLKGEKYRVIEGKGKSISQGWVDLKSDFCDPGYEHRETIQSGLKASAFGGYTHVFTVPSTNPFVDGKTAIEYALRKAEGALTQLHPIGSITKTGKGQELSEMFDMHLSGSTLFSDDLKELSTGMLSRALLYNKNTKGTVISFPQNPSLSNKTMVNEGLASIKTGLKGNPSLSEEVEIQKNISILKYTQGTLHLTGVSTQKGVELIKNAKKEGLKITASVNLMNLLFTEKEVFNFDSNFKLTPPLRTIKDQKALMKGLIEGTIDAIDSDHRPYEEDEKEVDFFSASAGCIQLQTLYSALNTYHPTKESSFIKALSINTRLISQIRETPLEVGNQIDATLYDPNKEWVFDKNKNLSKSFNSPFLNQKLKGKVCAVFMGKKALEF